MEIILLVGIIILLFVVRWDTKQVIHNQKLLARGIDQLTVLINSEIGPNVGIDLDRETEN